MIASRSTSVKNQNTVDERPFKVCMWSVKNLCVTENNFMAKSRTKDKANQNLWSFLRGAAVMRNSGRNFEYPLLDGSETDAIFEESRQPRNTGYSVENVKELVQLLEEIK